MPVVRLRPKRIIQLINEAAKLTQLVNSERRRPSIIPTSSPMAQRPPPTKTIGGQKRRRQVAVFRGSYSKARYVSRSIMRQRRPHHHPCRCWCHRGNKKAARRCPGHCHPRPIRRGAVDFGRTPNSHSVNSRSDITVHTLVENTPAPDIDEGYEADDEGTGSSHGLARKKQKLDDNSDNLGSSPPLHSSEVPNRSSPASSRTMGPTSVDLGEFDFALQSHSVRDSTSQPEAHDEEFSPLAGPIQHSIDTAINGSAAPRDSIVPTPRQFYWDHELHNLNRRRSDNSPGSGSANNDSQSTIFLGASDTSNSSPEVNNERTAPAKSPSTRIENITITIPPAPLFDGAFLTNLSPSSIYSPHSPVTTFLGSPPYTAVEQSPSTLSPHATAFIGCILSTTGNARISEIVDAYASPDTARRFAADVTVGGIEHENDRSTAVAREMRGWNQHGEMWRYRGVPSAQTSDITYIGPESPSGHGGHVPAFDSAEGVSILQHTISPPLVTAPPPTPATTTAANKRTSSSSVHPSSSASNSLPIEPHDQHLHVDTTLGSLHHANIQSRFSRWSSFSYTSSTSVHQSRREYWADVLKKFCCAKEAEASPVEPPKVVEDEKWLDTDVEAKDVDEGAGEGCRKVKDEFDPALGGMRNLSMEIC